MTLAPKLVRDFLVKLYLKLILNIFLSWISDSKDFLLKQKFIFDVLYHLHMPLGEEYVKDVHGFIEGKEYYNVSI